MPISNQVDYSLSMRNKNILDYKYISYVLNSNDTRYYIQEPRVYYLNVTQSPYTDDIDKIRISEEFVMNNFRPWNISKLSTLIDEVASYGISPAGDELTLTTPDKVPLFGVICPFDGEKEVFGNRNMGKVSRNDVSGTIIKFFIPPSVYKMNVVMGPKNSNSALMPHENYLQLTFGKDGNEAISTDGINMITSGYFKAVTIILSGMSSYERGSIVSAHVTQSDYVSHNSTLSRNFSHSINGNVLSSVSQDAAYNTRPIGVINGNLITDTYSKFFLGNPTKI